MYLLSREDILILSIFLDIKFYFKVKLEKKNILGNFLNIPGQKDFKLLTKNRNYTLSCTVVKFRTLTLFSSQGQIKNMS